jgi:hypothetical protein
LSLVKVSLLDSRTDGTRKRFPYEITMLSASLGLTGNNLSDLFHPPPSLGMLEPKQLLVRPVKVVRDIGHLLVQPVEWVAYDSPRRSASASKACWQCGQTTLNAVLPLRLMRL